MQKRHIPLAFLATVFLFIIHLFIIDDYSINWDFHHVFFAGLYHTCHPVTRDLWHGLPFSDPDPMRMVETPFGPLQSAIPVLSYTAFYEKLKVLAFDSAFNLPAVLAGAAGAYVLFIFLYQTFNPVTAWFGFLFLAAYPRYWGDLHTNVKDIPTAVLYALSVLFAYRAVNRRKWQDIVAAGILTGITFNFKVNAIFIPIIVGTWVLWLLVSPAKKNLAKPFKNLWDNLITPVGSYVIIACLSAFAIWAYFWKDPYDHLAYLIRFFQYNTTNMEVVLHGKWYCSGVNVPWYYPFWYLAIVTPLPILIFSVIGLFFLFFSKRRPASSLILLWFFIPLIRFVIPKASVIDGIRHFGEVVFPLMAMAAVGASVVSRIIPAKILALPLLLYLGYNIISYHPYQLSYYNELVGGLPGAVGKYDADYWGVSQKKTVQWLNDNAPENSKIHIVMSGDVAGKYLRPDLFATLNKYGYDESDYVVVLNRQSFFYRFFYSWEYFLRRKPVFEAKVRGVPLTSVYQNSLGKFDRRPNWWQGEDPCMRKYW